VDLVDEQDGPLIVHAEPVLGLGDGLAQFGDAGGDGADGLERGPRGRRDDPGERRLAGAGRTPEDERREAVGLGRLAQERTLADDVLLPDRLVKTAWTHPRRERRAGGQLLLAVGFEEVHGITCYQPSS